MQLTEVISKCLEYQALATQKGLVDIDIITMFRAFYEQHKFIHGSNKKYIGTGVYDDLMELRYNYCFGMIDETIKSKTQYHENQK